MLRSSVIVEFLNTRLLKLKPLVALYTPADKFGDQAQKPSHHRKNLDEIVWNNVQLHHVRVLLNFDLDEARASPGFIRVALKVNVGLAR